MHLLAAADEAIKGRPEPSDLSVEDQRKRQLTIEEINKSEFVPASFKSSRGDKNQVCVCIGQPERF